MADVPRTWRAVAPEWLAFVVITPWPLALTVGGVVLFVSSVFNDTGRPMREVWDLTGRAFGTALLLGAGAALGGGIVFSLLARRGFVAQLTASVAATIVCGAAMAVTAAGWHPEYWWLAAFALLLEGTGAAVAALVTGLVARRPTRTRT